MSELTRGRSGRWLLLALALALIIATAVLALPESASGSSHLTVEEDAGILLLSTGPNSSDNWVEYYPDAVMPSTEPGAPQASLGTAESGRQLLRTGRCDAVLDGNLLELTAAGGNGRVGLVNNGLGVKVKRNCATAEGRVGPGQALTIELADRFLDEDIFIRTIEADVEGKFNAEVGYDIGDGVVPLPLANGSDNGSDAGASDNDIAEIPGSTATPVFTSITFTAEGQDNAEISLEGGGDGDVTGGYLRGEFDVNQTLFHLVTQIEYDGELGCIEPTNFAFTPPDPSNNVAETVSVTRVANKNAEPGDECVLIPYRLYIDEGDGEEDPGGVFFEPDLVAAGQLDAQFLVEIKWTPYADPFTPPRRQISLTGHWENLEDVQACSGLTEGPTPNPDPDPDDVISHPAGVLWCMAGQRQDLQSNGEWQQVQWYHGGGDPRWR